PTCSTGRWKPSCEGGAAAAGRVARSAGLAPAPAASGSPRRAAPRVSRSHRCAEEEDRPRELPAAGAQPRRDPPPVARRRPGERLAIAVDQNMRPARGIFVDFFGEKACTTPAAAVFALRSGAPLVGAFSIRQADGTHLIRIRGPFSTALSGHAAVADLTQQVTRMVEEEIR